MKRLLALFMAIILLFATVGCNNSIQEGKKGQETLADKTPKELYAESVEYIKGLTNYEIVIQSDYKLTYGEETWDESSTTLHKSSGDSFYYLHKEGEQEAFYLHDGSMLYKKMNNIYEKDDIAYADFMEKWGGINRDGMLIELGDSSFDKKLFIPDGDKYYLEFFISKTEYAEITGGEVESPVEYRVHFDKDGHVISFYRAMTYYYDDVLLVEDKMTVNFQNVGTVEKVSAPENSDLYSVRVKAEDIDLSNVESLDMFEATGDVTEYVLLEIKIAGKTATIETETKADTDSATDIQAQAEGETEASETTETTETETTEDYYGKILIRLYPEVAPISVANFQMLVGKTFYNGLTIHRIIPEFVIQGGDPQGNGTGGSEEDIFGEFMSNGFTNNLSHKRGVVSMARADDPDSGSSQFFICLADVSATLDGEYAAFGYVVYGMDTVDYIAGVKTDSDDMPVVKVTIEKASFVKKKA